MGTKLFVNASGIFDEIAAGAVVVGSEPSANLTGRAGLETARLVIFAAARAACGFGDLWRRSAG